MFDKIKEITDRIEDKVINYRRDFHRFAESAWTEFRTASLIARRLTELGYEVRAGRDVVKKEDRMDLPSEELLEEHWQRAGKQGGDREFLELLRGGFTGVVGILKNGEGPTVGMRFDIDALEITENSSPLHRPAKEGFASLNMGVMHACGHDCHGATGLGIAEVLMNMKDHFRGTVKLIFQPAEEGVRGAKAMVGAGVVDDVNYLLAYHIVSGWKKGEIACGMSGYFASQKLDAFITGKPAHAGGDPEGGKNALQAAATAVLNLYAIPRHSNGPTRINVGKLTAGTSRNIICDHAHLCIETRGQDNRLNDYMYESALRILEASAKMYDCKLEIKPMGSARTAESDRELASRAEKVAEKIGGFTLAVPSAKGGCEDYTYMMERVQKNGGLATHLGIGADSRGIGSEDKERRDEILRAHTAEFDIDESALKEAVRLMVSVVLDILRI